MPTLDSRIDEETIKWSMPFFLYQAMLSNMASFKAHRAFGFWKGELLVAQEDDKGREAMGQFGRIASLKDLPPKKTLAGYEQAVEWIADGKKRIWKYMNC